MRGPRPPDQVWDRYVRPARWPEWSPQIRGVQYGPERLTPGTGGVVRGPFRLAVPFEVLSVDEEDPLRRAWRWRAGLLGVHVELEHVVEPSPSHPGGTLTRLVVSGPAPVAVPYLPLAYLALHRLVR